MTQNVKPSVKQSVKRKANYSVKQSVERCVNSNVKQIVKQSVIIYNTKRPHLSCQMLTPKLMHKQDHMKIKTYKKKISEKTAVFSEI